MGTKESSMNITLTIYRTVVERATHGYKTVAVYLPRELYKALNAEDIEWLGRKDLLGLSIWVDDSLTEPRFVDT